VACPARGTGIDDHNLPGQIAYGFEALAKEALLVLRDKADGKARGARREAQGVWQRRQSDLGSDPGGRRFEKLLSRFPLWRKLAGAFSEFFGALRVAGGAGNFG